METARAPRDGFYLMLLGTVFFVLFGIVLMNTGRVPLFDFRTAYYSGACLLTHCDPYSESDVGALYALHHERWPVSARDRQVITRNIYLPPAFVFTVPLALLPFELGQALWFILIASSFAFVAFLMGSAGSEHAPLLACCLIAFCLANSGSLLYFGNSAGFVVPFCVFAAWSFVRERVVAVGVVCLAASLAFKPHDAIFVWLYFLLAGGAYRRRALATLALIAAFGIPALLWVHHIAPHWLQEFAANLSAFSGPGAMNDPSAGHGTLVLTNLQTVTSFFWPDPHTYDLTSYLFCAPLFLVWGVVTIRARPTQTTAWSALAAVAPLTLLPVYHRQYDAKLILLAVPACALLWSRRGRVGWMAGIVTWIAFLLNGDLPWVAFLASLNHLNAASRVAHSHLLTAIWDFPVPISLLVTSIFYLWAYARETRPRRSSKSGPSLPSDSVAA